MEDRRHSPSPELMYAKYDQERSGGMSSHSNTPDIVANTTNNTSSEDIYNDDPTNSTNTSLVTTPVCCIDSRSHHLPTPPSQFPAKFNANSYPICDIPMQSLPYVPHQQTMYANTSSNKADIWQNRTHEVPVITSDGRSMITLAKPRGDQIVNPNDIYAKVDKTGVKPKKATPTYTNTGDITKLKETKITVEKTSPVDVEDIPREIPNTNIAVAFMVTCCFNLPIGGLAIFCSLIAAKAFRDGNVKKGERRTQISMILSLFGILVTVLIVMGVVLHLAMSSASDKQKRLGKLPKQSEFNL